MNSSNNKIIRRQRQSNFADTKYSPQLQNIFANRGITQAGELDLRLSSLLAISSLENVTAAADLLFSCIEAQQKIIILSDYDADGATACALSVKFLRQVGAVVSYQVPDRIKHGYGMSPEIVSEIIAQNSNQQPVLIMTVDNGIASHAGIRLARKHNIKVLVTDHHLPAATLPEANVIVNPNLTDSQFLSKNLAGVGVAFYVMCALHQKLTQLNWYLQQNIATVNPANLLDLVALGTVADVVTLDQNNRILVANGLKKIQTNNTLAGIKTLFKVAKRNIEFALATDLGFYIGPRINAAGRMQDMRIGIECLLDDNYDSALNKATQLHKINSTRREVEQQMQDDAKQVVNKFNAQQLPFGICLYQENWHEGVIGIVAGRLKEQHHRPTIVFAKSSDGMLKGSARSIAGFNIRDALDNVAKTTGLINKFGGHAMAAGLTIANGAFRDFSLAFDNEVRRCLSLDDFAENIYSDGELNSEQFTLAMAKTLQIATPWGQGFAEPIFDNEFWIVDYRVVGGSHLKLILRPKFVNKSVANVELDAIAFNTIADILPPRNQTVTMAYQLDINRWQGIDNLQLKIVYIEPNNQT